MRSFPIQLTHFLPHLALGIALICWGGVGSHGLYWINRSMGDYIYGDIELASCGWWIAAWVLGIPVGVAALVKQSKHHGLAYLALVLAVSIVGWNHFLWELAARSRQLVEVG
ncbi:hypothetical protein [Armatimonas rosea]|uniref:Uncharacterized protein n=1 Tax=Armatimonas rosea TaxID=685828 RepID=A0A7W9SLH8_ARMRO|nr:hypothetical protein [Armatimonas rosea]MBB6048354.1 hypothetical protein [Armatimonas rosea]